MNKKILLPILGIALCSSIAFGVAQGVSASEPSLHTYTVDFFNNYAREDLQLSNGRKAKGNNLLYMSVEALEANLLEKPTDPTRKNYDFAGWFKETDCKNEWDFSKDTISGNLRLYAKWTYSTSQEDNEPPYTPPSTVLDNSATTDYVIDSVMNFKIISDQVSLPTAALSKLTANKDNVLPLMEYKVKAGKSITATYASNNITVTCGGASKVIAVKDDSLNLKLENETYEGKAKKYEANALEEESYHVMLAGSSSIEFWTVKGSPSQPWPKLATGFSAEAKWSRTSSVISSGVGVKAMRFCEAQTWSPGWKEMQPRQWLLQALLVGSGISQRPRA